MATVDARTRGIASGIYGLVVAGATLATAASFDSLWAVAGAVLVTVFVYWAAESYAHALATRQIRERALTAAEIREVLRQGWPMVSASYLPLLALVTAGLLGASVWAAALTGLIVTTVLMGVVGATASWRSGLRGARLVGSALIAVAFGLVMIGLKLRLH